MVKSAALVRRTPVDTDLDAYADRITQALNKTVEGIFETGRQLLAARTKLEHGQWLRLFDEGRVPIGIRTAQRLIEIYKRRDILLPNATHASHLPPSWMTLYDLARLPDDTLAWAHANDRIRPDLERKAIAALCAEYEGAPLPSRIRPATSGDFNAQMSITKLIHAIRTLVADWPDVESLAPLIAELRRESDYLSELQERRG